MADNKTSSFGRIALIMIGVVLAILGINYLIKTNKKGVPTGTERLSFDLPTTVDPAVFGPQYWKAFHTLAHEVPCGFCRGFAERFMVFMHDMVNVKLGKPIYDVTNFNYFTDLIAKIAANDNKWPKPPVEKTVEVTEEVSGH